LIKCINTDSIFTSNIIIGDLKDIERTFLCGGKLKPGFIAELAPILLPQFWETLKYLFPSVNTHLLKNQQEKVKQINLTLLSIIYDCTE
jgi:hypothetical protein